MEVGIDGKSGLLVPVNTEASGPAAGEVPVGVPLPADPSTPAAGWHAGPSDSVGSSNWRAELSDESTAGPSAGPSLAGPSLAGPSLAGPSLAGPSTVSGPSTVAGPSTVSGPSPAGPSVTSAGPVTGAGPSTSSADSSTWTCRTGEEMTVIVLFSGGLAILRDNCTSRLATYKGPVLSALSRLLSWWLSGDLRPRSSVLLGRGGCFLYSGCWLGHWRAEQTADIR